MDRERGRPTRTRRTHRHLLVLGSLVIAACQTVGVARPPISVTATAGPVTAPPETAPRNSTAPGVSQTRGLWVVRSTLVHPDSVRAMVARAASAGFNTILIQVRGRGDAYYSGGIEPRAAGIVGRPDFDPLALAVREAHARGIEVHAWINVHLVSSGLVIPRDPTHLVNQRPGLLAVPRELATELYDMDPASPRYVQRLAEHALANSRTVEGLFTSPSSPEVKERVYTIATDLVDRYDIDGVHLDYVRFPSGAYDYSRGALDRFRAWVDGGSGVPSRAPAGERLSGSRRAELAAAAIRNPLAFADALPDSWDEFRRDQITDLVERVYVGVKRRRPEVVLSAAVLPNAQESFLHRYQDWEGWLRRGIIDVVAPMAYNPDDGLFSEAISHAARVGGPDRVWAGVGTYLTTYEGTLRKIDITQRIGVRGFLLFSYDWSVANGASQGGRPFLERVGLEAQSLNR